MSTVKIKTEPTAAATTAAVDVRVKLEPSLSTADIKLEQNSSDIDTKVESDSDTDSDIKSENEDDDEDTDRDQTTITPKTQRQFICKHPGCDRRFNSAGSRSMHQHEHKLQTELNTHGKTYILTRQSLDDRWSCPIPDCISTAKTIAALCVHIRNKHGSTTKHQQNQQHPSLNTQQKRYFIDVDNFHVNGVRYGYHTTTGVFICHECRLVPECLLTHSQQKHGYGEKSIESSVLPESAVNATADPNINQHTSNTYLVSAISQPHWRHPDVVQGWLCVTSDCGYCGYTTQNKASHKKRSHYGGQLLTVPALVLRLISSKAHASCFLITRIDQASGAVTVSSSNRVNRHRLDYSHNGLNARNENGDDVYQNETTDASNSKRQWKCEYPDCEHVVSSSAQLSSHRREHKLEAVINVQGSTFTLNRQSLDDRWPCPFPDCNAAYKTVCNTHGHVLRVHCTETKQKRATTEDEDINQQQQLQNIKRQRTIQYLNVNDFYVCGTRYGYHNTIGVFICHECRLAPECLLTHLQQKHGFDEKSIDSAILPESARMAGSDPNVNQHTSNPHITAAINQPSQPRHPDAVQGWLCITSGCGHCGYTLYNKKDHKKFIHKGKQLSTVPALVLRLLYGKTQTLCFLITRLDATTNNVKPSDSTNQCNNECDTEDGDELVLSDYSEEDDIN